MEVIPCLLPTFDSSQVASLVMVVHAESNDGYDLLWLVIELSVLSFDPTMQISTPVWMGEDIFCFLPLICSLFLPSGEESTPP
jgi:hypothetical protein